MILRSRRLDSRARGLVAWTIRHSLCWRHGLGVVALFMSDLALAQPCEERYRVGFADGQTVCMDQHAFGQRIVHGTSKPVAALLPRHGVYALYGPRGPVCPDIVYLYIPPYLKTERRRWLQDAKGECNRAVNSAGNSDDACGCRQLVLNQMSPLTRPQFEKRTQRP